MKLYYFPPSPNTRKVLALMHHLGLSLDLQLVDLLKGEQMKPDYLKLNPNHLTPALQDGDFVLWESEAIMQYLASQKPGSALWPSDPKIRADISRWQCWQLGHWGPACGTLIYECLAKPLLGLGDPDPAEIAKGTDGFNRFAAILNQHLKGKKWIAGGSVTLAEFSLGAPLTYAEAARFPMEPYGEIRRWYAGLEQLESWKKSAPPPLGQK